MKKTLCVTLALLLALSLALPAAAADDNLYVPEVEDPFDPYQFELPFEDVSTDDSYYPAVVWALQEGVTWGTGDTTFSPGQSCTRGQVVTFLWRAKGMPEPKSGFNPYKDVAEGSYYETAVLWAVENGITAGTSEDTFSPEATCTWAHILTFLWRANGRPEPAGEGITAGWPETWYTPAVAWADATGILGIDREGFDPDRDCNRGTTVTWLCNDAVKVVNSTNALMEAIGPGRTIYIQPGEYDLGAWAALAVMEERCPAGGYVTVAMAADGYEIHIQNCPSLRLRSENGTVFQVKLTTGPRHAEVLYFENCGEVELYGLTVGHTEGGACEGGVLRFVSCDSVYLEALDLYGCGTYGLETRDVGWLNMKYSCIHDCSYGIMDLHGTAYAQFDGCSFRDNERYNMLTLVGTAAFFDECIFENNMWITGSRFVYASDDDNTVAMFTDCHLDSDSLDALRAESQINPHVSGNFDS